MSEVPLEAVVRSARRGSGRIRSVWAHKAPHGSHRHEEIHTPRLGLECTNSADSLHVQGYLAHKKPPPPLGTPYGPRHMLL